MSEIHNYYKIINNKKHNKRMDFKLLNKKKFSILILLIILYYKGRVNNRIGMVLYLSINYGSALVNLSLFQILQKLGYEPILLENYGILDGFKSFKNLSSCFKKLSDIGIEENDISINKNFNKFGVGSDYLWSLDFYRTFHYKFFLQFVDSNKRLISFAPRASFQSYNNDQINIAEYYMKRFKYISVRENNSQKIIKKLFKIDSKVILDPLLLNGISLLEELSKKSNVKENNYILAYVLDPTYSKNKIIYKLMNKYKLKVIYIEDRDSPRRIFNIAKAKENIDLAEFVFYFKNANVVFTDSFHGLVLSLLYKKNVVAIKNRGIDRFNTLCDNLEKLNDIVYNDINDFDKRYKLNNLNYPEIDYVFIHKKIDDLRKDNLKWIKNSLK